MVKAGNEEISLSLDVICVCNDCPVVTKLAVRVAMAVSFEVVSPETIVKARVSLWPVLIKFVVSVDMSLSLLVI